MKKDYTVRIIALAFIICCFSFLALNSRSYLTIVNSLIDQEQPDADKQAWVSDTLKANFAGREAFIDIYGITQRILGKHMIGEYEFLKDRGGTIHLFGHTSNLEYFADEVQLLAEYSNQKDTPLLYVQAPPRAVQEDIWPGGHTANNENEAMEYWEETFMTRGIDYLDCADIEGTGYFKTDAHMTTQSELKILEALVAYLKQEYGIEFYNEDIVMNWSNYTLDRRNFVGNFAKSVGKYYTDTDFFDMYFPNFETLLRRYDENGQVVAEGDFQHAIMNGYHLNPDADENTYWVTNYGNFTKPTYRYENLNAPNGPNILLVMDSQGYRTASYLSLMCHSVTIVDPRFGNNGYTLFQVMEQNFYDAVIIMQGTTLSGQKLVSWYRAGELEAEIISHNAPSTVNHSDSYTIQITARNNGTRVWSEGELIRLCIWQDGMDHGYRVYLPAGVTVAPGEQYTFVLEGFVLPEADATVLEFQMLREGITYFGERESVSIFAE